MDAVTAQLYGPLVSVDEMAKAIRACSGSHFVVVPTLWVHGGADTVVNVRHSIEGSDAFRKVAKRGARDPIYETAIIPNMPHFWNSHANDRMGRFFEKSRGLR